MSMYEVLAPVGSFNELGIILNEKPDAVYVGMKGFTSRPARTDFSAEEIKLAIDNQFADDCAEGCLKREKMLIPANNGIETTIDGYVLGWQYVYDESVKSSTTFNHCNIYADSFSVAAMKLNELRECQ